MRARSVKKRPTGFPARHLLGGLLSLPASFLAGLVVGLAAPLAALAGIVGGVYLFTNKVPFFRHEPADPETGARTLLTLQLMSRAEAQAALEAWRADLEGTWSAVEEIAQEAAQAEAEPES
jgi:hypothetical protein